MSKKTSTPSKSGAESQIKYLRLISGNEGFILDPCDGKKTLAKAEDIFAFIDRNLEIWGADEPGGATKETPINIFEMVEDATFTQMLGSLSREIKQLCLTQDQIIGFVRKYRQWVQCHRNTTLFLFQSYNNFFVALVRFYSDKLEVHVGRFEDSGVWSADYHHRLVIPRLA